MPIVVSFLALYRGKSLETAELVGISTDPEVVAYVAGALLQESSREPAAPGDQAVDALSQGRRRALKIIRHEAEDAR